MKSNSLKTLFAILSPIGIGWGIMLKVFAEKYPVHAVVVMTLITAVVLLGWAVAELGDEDNDESSRRGFAPIPFLLIIIIFVCLVLVGYMVPGK